MKDTEVVARALILKFMQPIDELHKYPMCFDTAKQCALISVDEIIDSIHIGFEDYKALAKNSYYNEVKQELQKL